MKSKRVVDLRGHSPRPVAIRTKLAARPQRVSALRYRRRRTRLVTIATSIVVFAGVIYGLHIAAYMPQARIGEIRIEGERQVPERLIHAYAASLLDDGMYRAIPRDNIILYPRTVLEGAIESFFPLVSSVSVKRDSLFANALTVHVTERTNYAHWCMSDVVAPSPVEEEVIIPVERENEDEEQAVVSIAQHAESSPCYSMDNGGYVFANARFVKETPSRVYVFYTRTPSDAPIGSIYADGRLPEMIEFMDALARDSIQPMTARVEDAQDYTVHIQDGYSLKATFGENPETMVNNLRLILSSESLREQKSRIDYVDLRFGNRVYYKLRE